MYPHQNHKYLLMQILFKHQHPLLRQLHLLKPIPQKEVVKPPPSKTKEELKAEVSKASKQILLDLQDHLVKHPDPRTMMTSKSSFICRSYALMGIMFEMFLLNEPNSIVSSIHDLLQQEVINSFYCPCGSSVSEEVHLMIHMRQKHKES